MWDLIVSVPDHCLSFTLHILRIQFDSFLANEILYVSCIYTRQSINYTIIPLPF